MARLLYSLLLVLVIALPARAAELKVFAAASLTEAMRAIMADFEKTRPATSVNLQLAASGSLLRRILAGETADVLITADTATMDAAVEKRQVDPASRRDCAGNTLVMAVPAGNPAKVATLDDLSRGGVRRVGVGNPDLVPAGRYAKRALQQQALWFALTSKLVYYPSVRHVLAALAKGEVEAGFVYRTDAVLPGAGVTIVADIPLSPPVTYVAARTTASPAAGEAAALLDYLSSPPARDILTRFGFTVP